MRRTRLARCLEKASDQCFPSDDYPIADAEKTPTTFPERLKWAKITG